MFNLTVVGTGLAADREPAVFAATATTIAVSAASPATVVVTPSLVGNHRIAVLACLPVLLMPPLPPAVTATCMFSYIELPYRAKFSW